MEAENSHQRRKQNSLYQQLAVTSVGNALALALLLLLYQVWSILSDYQDALLYALLCSIALREPKSWLVERISTSLSRERSIGWALLSVAALPLTSVVDAYRESRSLLAKWRRYVAAAQEEWQRRNFGGGRSPTKRTSATGSGGGEDGTPQTCTPRANGSAASPFAAAAGQRPQPQPQQQGGTATPGSPSTPKSQTAAPGTLEPKAGGVGPSVVLQSPAGAPQSMPTLALYARAGLQVLKSRRTSRKRQKRKAASRAKPVVASSVLFRWLLRACVAWLAYEWVRDSWSTTVQLLVLGGTTFLVLGALPLLYFTTNRYLGAAVFSPVKTPGGVSTAGRSGAGEAYKRGRGSEQQRRGPGPSRPVTPPKRPRFSPGPADKMGGSASPDGGSGKGGLSGASSGFGSGQGGSRAERAARSLATSGARWLGTTAQLLADAWAAAEARLRSALRANLHALVSLMLIAALMLGTSGLAAFLTVRVAQEGRATVLAVRDVFPAAWAGVAASTPLLADAVSDAGDGGSIGDAAARAAAAVPPWVRAYQTDALALAQRALPQVATWVDRRLQQFVASNNLTSALSDMRLVYETLQGPRRCNEREREKLLIAVARADVAASKAAASKAEAEARLDDARHSLQAAVAALSAQREAEAEDRNCSAPPSTPVGLHAEQCSGSSSSDEQAARGSGERRLEEAVVAADARVTAAKVAHKAALRSTDEAEKRLRSAQSRLDLCSVTGADGGDSGGGHDSMLPPALREVGEALQRAYAKLWRRQLREGWAEMRAAAGAAASALRNATQHPWSVVGEGVGSMGSMGAADLGTLHRLAQAAADPLLAAARVFAGSLGSTTAAALMGGLGLVRLGVGVVKFGMQLALFLALLYYLLAARRDPLGLAVGVLPLSESGRQRAAVALNRALGGVFLSSMKLMAFHGGFTWLTFRAFAIPLCYTAAVASAAAALLPFVPTYLVALPGCLLLGLQGRALAAIVFGLLHFLGYYLGDTVILEDIPGGHPYMLSLGILGGIYTFDNPLQGCLMGPILLSLLSVFYALHNDFMGHGDRERGDREQDRGGGGSLGHRLSSITEGGLSDAGPSSVLDGASLRGGRGNGKGAAAAGAGSLRPSRLRVAVPPPAPASPGALPSPEGATSGARSPEGLRNEQQQQPARSSSSAQQHGSISLGGGRLSAARRRRGSAEPSSSESERDDGDSRVVSGSLLHGGGSFSFLRDLEDPDHLHAD